MGGAQRKGPGILSTCSSCRQSSGPSSLPPLCFRHPHSHTGDTVGCPNPLHGNVLSQPLVELSVDGAQLLPLKVSRTQGQALPTQPALGDPWTLVPKGLAASAQLGTTPGATPTSQLPGRWPRPVSSSRSPAPPVPLPPTALIPGTPTNDCTSAPPRVSF